MVLMCLFTPAEAVPFKSDNGDEESDSAFLDLLKGLRGDIPKGKQAEPPKLADLDLSEEDVAKVCPSPPPSPPYPPVCAFKKSSSF